MKTNQITPEKLCADLSEMISDLFDVDPDDVHLETSPDTIESWDSIGHIRLIASIEEKYGLKIPPEDQIEMLNFDLILGLLAEKLSNQS